MEEELKKEKVIVIMKKALGSNFISKTEDILFNIYKEMYSIALNTSHLKSKNKEEILYPYVKEAAVSKYLRMGAEGISAKSEGSQSNSFIDIENKLRNDIIKSGLRRLP